MGFGAVVGAGASLAGSIFGASTAAKQAQRDREWANFRASQSQNLADAQFNLSLADRRIQQEENAYQRVMNSLMRRQAGQERQFQINELNAYKSQLLEERAADIRRQVTEDRAAAKQREFQLQQLLRNQELSAQERAFALEELKRAQEIASGEREEELIRFYEDRAEKDIEREFYISQMGQARQDYQDEREYDLGIRNRLLQRMDELSQTAQMAYDELPMVQPLAQVDQRDIMSEALRREQQYVADVDRAADRVASVGEAGLIRRGMDESDTATDERARIAARLAGEYADARKRARDEATSYISGIAAARNEPIIQQMAQNRDRMAMATGAAEAGMNYFAQLPGVTSTVGQYNLLGATPTGILDRDIMSANNYRSPVNITSAIYDDMRVGTGLAEYRRPSTASDAGFFNVRSAIYDPYVSKVGNYSIGNPASIYNNLASEQNRVAMSSAENARAAGKGVGDAMKNFFDEAGFEKSLDNWWSNRNKAGM
tara:strand:- start:18178 stop:19641 length:1464 start_codon:yes stop_codon:yes gene_type:complete